MKFVPKNDNVLVEPIREREEMGQLAMADMSKKKPMMGKVIAVGPGRFDEEINVKVGEKVIFPQHSGVTVELDGIKYLAMPASNLFGSVED